MGKFEIDSAACGMPTMNYVSAEAREAITIKYGQDLLTSHKPKKITPALVQQADVILVMAGWMKAGLPTDKTFTLKEFAGDSGDILDPFGQGIDTYLAVAAEIAEAIDKILPKLQDCEPDKLLSERDAMSKESGSKAFQIYSKPNRNRHLIVFRVECWSSVVLYR